MKQDEPEEEDEILSILLDEDGGAARNKLEEPAPPQRGGAGFPLPAGKKFSLPILYLPPLFGMIYFYNNILG